jgi:hypothetical protein
MLKVAKPLQSLWKSSQPPLNGWLRAANKYSDQRAMRRDLGQRDDGPGRQRGYNKSKEVPPRHSIHLFGFGDANSRSRWSLPAREHNL